ncbi:MAG: shikimate kinase [Bacteroidota bacterium]
MRIYLIGYMGSGKSSRGAELAKKLDYTFIDLDEMIEKDNKISIPTIFKTKGENVFREMEQEALRKTFKKKNIVVATGGGTPCFFDNLAEMRENGTTIYIQASIGLLFHRLAASKTERPMLKDFKDVELVLQIKDQMAYRERFYEKANYIIDAEDLKANDLVKLLANELKKEQ